LENLKSVIFLFKFGLTCKRSEEYNYRENESRTPTGVKSHSRVPGNTNQPLFGTQNIYLATR